MKRRATEMALSYINSDNYQASYNASLAMKEDDSSILAHVFKIVTVCFILDFLWKLYFFCDSNL